MQAQSSKSTGRGTAGALAFVTSPRARWILAVSALLVVALIAATGVVWLRRDPDLRSGAAPNAPGQSSSWAPTTNSFLGTAANDKSLVWFTGGQGVVTATFYPNADTVNSSLLEFVVGDREHHWAEEERAATTSRAVLIDPKALAWKVTNTAKSGAYSIEKTIYADPARNTIVQDVTFTVRKGHLADYQLYAVYDPALHNTGDANLSSTQTGSGRTALVTSDYTGDYSSALGASLPYVSGHTSSGYIGESDGLTDLLGKSGCGSDRCPDYRMSFGYSSTEKGNTAQLGEIDLSNGGRSDTSGATRRAFRLALTFGQKSAAETATSAALATLDATLKDASDLLGTYVGEWRAFDDRLKAPPAVGPSAQAQQERQAEYYLSVNILKASQDKRTGAIVAGLGNPWGPSHGEDAAGGYHLVWMRDLYKVASALIVAGDSEDAKRALQWAFDKQQQSDGHFPQNSFVDGTVYWTGIQMDEQAFPLLLAQKVGLTDPETYSRSIRPAADYILAHGPATQQERWEENGGYSPSTLAAEIAGLRAAAKIAGANGDTANAARYQTTANDYAAQVDGWTFTTTGPLSQPHYERIDADGKPNDNEILKIGNGGGVWDEREIVDAGFLELVRLGVKSPHDPSILASLAVVDATIRQTINGAPYFYRYNHDGYGEAEDGSDYVGTGVGRLWPLLSAERGVYEVSAGGDPEPYLNALMSARGASGFIPEQIWDQKAPAGETPGKPTRSMNPLNWAMAEYVTLLVSTGQGSVAG